LPTAHCCIASSPLLYWQQPIAVGALLYCQQSIAVPAVSHINYSSPRVAMSSFQLWLGLPSGHFPSPYHKAHVCKTVTSMRSAAASTAAERRFCQHVVASVCRTWHLVSVSHSAVRELPLAREVFQAHFLEQTEA
jgi:hypothetical protein